MNITAMTNEVTNASFFNSKFSSLATEVLFFVKSSVIIAAISIFLASAWV